MEPKLTKNTLSRPKGQAEKEGGPLPVSPGRIEVMAAVDPEKAGRSAILPPLSLLLMHSMDREKVQQIKARENIPVLVVFPARGDEELLTLEREIQILQPLLGRIIDEIWIAFGGSESDDIPLMARKYGVKLFYAHRNGMNDARKGQSGKGLSMRGMLYHLVTERGLDDPRAVIQFIDADIREGFFNPRWVIDPVGAVLWFHHIEVAKIVYHRPLGGRLNAFIAPFLSVFDHPALNPLKNLVYFLSGEIAGTLRFWLSVPFKQNFGIEMKILTSLALNRLNLAPRGDDLTRALQVFMGEMDHKHSPLRSTARVKGLDAMAKEVFHSFLEDLSSEGLIRMEKGLSFSPRLEISTVTPAAEGGEEMGTPTRLNLPSEEKTFSPLRDMPEVRERCSWLKTG